MLEFGVNLLDTLDVPSIVHLDEIEEGKVFKFRGASSPHLFIKRQSAKLDKHKIEAVCLSLTTQRFFIVAPNEMKEVQVIGECKISFEVTQLK